MYWLNKDVYCELVGDACVVLDLTSDRYMALELDQCAGLVNIVADWPSCPSYVSPSHDISFYHAVAAELTRQGVLSDSGPMPHIAMEDPAPPVSTVRSGEFMKSPFKFNPRIFVNFIVALLVGSYRFRYLSLQRVLGICQRHKLKRRATRLAAKPVNYNLLMSHYVRYRACTFTARGRCVLDSYVLFEYLLRNGAEPTLVHGVMMRPFKAHCWVQCDSAVINDTVETVKSFTPIVSV